MGEPASRLRSPAPPQVAQPDDDRFVTIASADIIHQALNLELVDEICVSQIPVLFGSGIRYFGENVGAHVMLEDPVAIVGVRALHLRYPVRR